MPLVEHGITEQFEHARAKPAVSKEPATKVAVPATRERVTAVLEHIGQVEDI